MEASLQHEKLQNRGNRKEGPLSGLASPPLRDEEMTRLESEIGRACARLHMDPVQIQKRLDEMLIGPWPRELVMSLVVRSCGEEEQTKPRAGLERLPEVLLSREYQKGFGAVMTPPEAAREMVRLVPDTLVEGAVLDPACGHGELLIAARRRWPKRKLVGCELHPGLALIAALRLLEVQEGEEDESAEVQIFVGDGLSYRGTKPALVIGNPPYVGEKGNRELFEKIKVLHERLGPIFAPRMDLLYLFLARGMELVVNGGWCVWLTPPYWLSADGAQKLRAMLYELGSPRWFIRLDEPDLFAALPGQSHLIFGLKRTLRGADNREHRAWTGRLSELEELNVEDLPMQRGDGIQQESWRPFLQEHDFRLRAQLRQRGRQLQELLEDFQGFVSGADKVTERHRKIAGCEELMLGDPIFVADAATTPPAWKELPPGICRPLLRARHLKKNLIIDESPEDAFCLYVDQAVAEEHRRVLEEHLASFRPILARRREVRQGRMPWVRLHWPREWVKMARPKLVVPRRVGQMCFSLDLSGAPVSSDCTFLTAPDDVKNPVEYLIRLMVLLNDEWTEQYFLRFGKRKGTLMEFYSTPLRNLPLAATICQGQVRYESTILGRARAQNLEQRVRELMVPLRPR